jgi:uncharacterized protein YceK
MNLRMLLLPFSLIVVVAVSGCATTNQRILDSDGQTQVQKRSYQTRIFDTNNKEVVMRGVISTLQDLSFVVEKADFALGAVTGTKFAQGQVIRISVTVRPKGATQMVVRATAQFGVQPIEDPKSYQDFFASLEKSLFLTAQLGE